MTIADLFELPSSLSDMPRQMRVLRSVFKSVFETQDDPTDTDVMTDEPYKVVLFNDDYHTFEEVIEQIIKATRCSREKAERHTWEVHNRGRSIVYDGEMMNCLRVSAILEEINLKTEIQS